MEPEKPSSASAAAAAAATSAPPRGYVEIGYIFAAVGAFLFATKAVAIKLAYQEPVDAATLLALRMAMALPFYAAIAWLATRDLNKRGDPLPSAGLVLKSAAVGAIGYWFASYTDFLGLEYISASFERLILFTYPFFVVVFGAMFFGQAMSLRVLVAVGLSYVGLAVIFMEKLSLEGHNTTIGASLVLSAAIAFALYQLLAKNLISKVGPKLFTCIAMAGAGAGAFLQFFVTHPPADLLVSGRVYLLALFLGIGSTVIPSFFMNAALHRISAQANATIGTLSPVATILLAVALLGERLSLTDIAGTALVLVGVGWYALAERNAAK